MRRLLLLTVIVALPACAFADKIKPLPADQFDAFRQAVRPTAEEDKWATIPWQTSLWEARKLAAAQGKPILLWEMDGHPLGCT